MVRGFSMESQDMRMCKTEPVIPVATVDYSSHRVYDDDCFGDILDMLDFPMESLEGDGFAEDWASKLGPIPPEVFKEVIIGGFNHQADIKPPHPSQPSFEAPSPNSVLESRASTLNNKGVSIPVKTRSKRSKPTANAWLRSRVMVLRHKGGNVTTETKGWVDSCGRKKCAHCEITKTPQWREGPMGPKTLCNACGVRYRSGRLYPEYRPAASPTFVPALHSNSHRKVIEMRQKVVK